MTAREQRFIEQYLICWNGAQSAKQAGFSPKWADREANRLLKRADIQMAIEARKRQLIAHADLQAEQVLQEFVDLGFSNMGDYVSWDAEGNVTVKPSDELTKGQKAAIKKIESDWVTTVDETGKSETRAKLRIELHPKEGPLTKLGEKYGLFPKAPPPSSTTNIQVNNYQAANDPFNLAALSVEEQMQLQRLLERAASTPPRDDSA